LIRALASIGFVAHSQSDTCRFRTCIRFARKKHVSDKSPVDQGGRVEWYVDLRNFL
jgi:hypothetical protein